MLFGHIVFTGEACGVLKEYNRFYSEHIQHIISTHSLTTDVAFYVISNSVCGIISEESSFATHGANILRCFFSKSKKEIAWVSGIKRTDIVDLFEKKVFITSEGQVIAIDNAEYTNYKNKISNSKNVSYVPLSKRSIINYNISNNSYTICYWPHRQFDILTFSIMREGLSKNLYLFGVDTPYIFMDSNGSIWFENAPLVSELTKLAKNLEYAIPMLIKQINTYSDILTRLQGDYIFSDLVEMIIDYFSVFILFHDTYEDVLVESDLFFKKNLEESIRYQTMNLLMSCKIDEWMLNNNILLEKQKRLLSTEMLTPIPKFSINFDIDYCIMRFYNFLVDLGYEKFWIINEDQIKFYITFFVAKEWKFVMNKILFTRFSDSIQKLLPDISFAELSLKNIYDVKEMIKET